MNNILKVSLIIVSIILASFSASAFLNNTAIVGFVAPINNSILTGTVTLNFTINTTSIRANGINISQVNYTAVPLEGGNAITLCANGTGPGLNGNGIGNVTQCTFNSALFSDGLYNITIHIANQSGANLTGTPNSTTFLAGTNISIENFGPRVKITSPGNATAEASGEVINNTILVDANFLNREFDINFSLRDNVAAQNRSFFCELHLINNIGSSTAIGGGAAINSFLLNKTIAFSNGTNVTFKVPSRNVLLNGSNSTFQVKCRNSGQAFLYNISLLQTFIVSDVVLPQNATSPTFTDLKAIEKTKFEFGDKITISDCSGIDNVDEAVQYNITIKLPGITSYTLNNVTLSFIDTKELGTYEVNCSATDSSGNINSSMKTFEIIPKVRDQRIVKIEKPKATIIVAPGTTSDIPLSVTGEARLMTEDSALTFNFKGAQHTLKVIDVSASEVEIEVSSEPVRFRIKVGETKEIDLNGDNINDILVTLNTLISKKADLSISLITQPSETKETAGREVSVPQKKIKAETEINWTTILIVLIIIILVVLIVYYFKHRGKGGIRFTPKDLGEGKEEISQYQPPSGFKFPGQ